MYVKQLFLFFIKLSCSGPEYQLFVDVTVTLNVDSSYSLFTQIFLHIRTY